jgi:hypothetical protein
MGERTFDIFMETIGADELWLEAVLGLVSARQRMEQLAAHSPGHYFLFDVRTNSILARIDSRKSALGSR